MKKFLIFLVSIIVLVCVGMTTYYFLRNDETINFKTKEIYCNAGDIITLKELGFERTKDHKDTTINYNAGGDAVTSMVNYDADKGYYVVGDQGGDVTLLIKTSNKKFAEFKVNVHIGNGTESHPYYIDDETTLARIGTLYGLDKHYQLQNDILVSNSFKTIGYNSQAQIWTGFEGSFNGNGYSISGLRISNLDSNKAGLFSTIQATAVVKNLNIKNAKIEGVYDSVGVLAGEIYGSVSGVSVDNSEIINSKSNANVGSLAGLIKVDNLTQCKANNVSISATGANSKVGGFAGKIEESFINACYASKVAVQAGQTSSIGGFVGEYVIGTDKGSIQQSYANVTSICSNFYGFVGTINTSSDFDVAKASMLRTLIGNIAVSNGAVVGEINVPNRADSKPFFPTKDGNIIFRDETNGFYLITNYSSEEELILETSLIFYEADPEEENTIVNWDSNVWINENNILPELRKTIIRPTSATSDYVRRSLDKVLVDSVDDLVPSINTTFVLKQNLQLPANWTPINLEGNIINGKGFEISFADEGNISLFGTVVNSSIKNLKLTNVSTLEGSNGALASSVSSTDEAVKSSIDNVTVEYVKDTIGAEIFGGLVGSAENTIINNCSVSGLNYVGDSNVVAGLIAMLTDSTISNSSVTATVKAKQKVGGVVAENSSSVITNTTGTVAINHNSTESAILAGGIAATNNGEIKNSNISASINVTNGSSVKAGGVVAENNGTIESTVVSGDGITIGDEVSGSVVLGGVAAVNNATISDTTCSMTQVGSLRSGKNDIVGGVAAYNNTATSKITKVVAGADLYGNVVGGVVAYMDSSSDASIDQVLVGKLDALKIISDNTIKGDDLVAGVVVELSAGSISNIQTSSNIIGDAHSTKSSLIVLIFQDGTKLTNASINNSFEGNGSFYMDTWNDFATSTDKDKFGFLSNDASFNVYSNDVASGSLQSVVVNTEKAESKGVRNIKESEFTGSIIWVRLDYENTAESSYYKKVNSSEFGSSATYKTDWSQTEDSGLFGWGKTEFNKAMTFDFEGPWSDSNGVKLAFLNK